MPRESCARTLRRVSDGSLAARVCRRRAYVSAVGRDATREDDLDRNHGDIAASFSDAPKPPCNAFLLPASSSSRNVSILKYAPVTTSDILREIGDRHVVEELPAQVADGEARVVRLGWPRDARVSDQEVDTAPVPLVVASTTAWSESFDAT
ncbi:hypothetical protein DL765_011561 [Monosporascus sp. GIB2]|nr:hypothetical protein DL765_011561 [Monosporascus sp. GIB2]